MRKPTYYFPDFVIIISYILDTVCCILQWWQVKQPIPEPEQLLHLVSFGGRRQKICQRIIPFQNIFQNGFPPTAFAICLVVGTDLKIIQGLVFLFKVHPDLPRPMRLHSDIRNNSRRKRRKNESYKMYWELEIKNDRLLIFALQGVEWRA